MENLVCTKKDLLLQTSHKINENFVKSINYPEINLNEIFEYIEVINNWCRELSSYEANVVLKETSYSLISSLHIALSGFYREAYLSLRSSLESVSYFIFFIDNNYSYLKWKKNAIDINWSNLKDEENGVLSKKYLELFAGKAKFDKLVNEINKVYRICSEYVHGKYDYMFINKFCKIDFDLESLKEFLSIYLNVIRIVNVMLCIRFKDNIKNINGDYLEIIKNDYIRYGITYLEE